MSIVTWKSEFYQIDATAVTAKEATAHSLKKWRGLTPENLKKHGLTPENLKKHGLPQPVASNLRDTKTRKPVFAIDSTTCALCQIFLDDTKNIGAMCDSCPLFEQLGYPCDFHIIGPYLKWLDEEDPFPMIEALEKTLTEVEDADVQ